MDHIQVPVMELSGGPYMDLSKLLALGGDSHVLQALACIDDDTSCLRCLREVSKEIGRYALLALSKYTLTLKGGDKDTNVSGASLLQQAKLRKLEVHLRLTSTYSPAYHLRTFVDEVGTALATVTYLDLHLEDNGSGPVTSAVLDRAIKALLVACPGILRLRCSKGHLSTAFLQTLHNVCPTLTTLELCAHDEAGPYLQETLTLQPSVFPNITKLVLHGDENELPGIDMSSNTSITTMVLDRIYLGSESHWLFLPPNLHTLDCAHFTVGPPATTAGSASLPNLLSFNIGESSEAPLHALAQLLRAAPALKFLDSYTHPFIHSEPCLTMQADFRLVCERTDCTLVRNATYMIDYSMSSNKVLLQPLITALPCMTGITDVSFNACLPEDLGLLLSKFPEVQHLSLWMGEEFEDDSPLQELESCVQLRTLKLVWCQQVTPMGLLALCMRIPTLKTVTCISCNQLTGPVLSECGRVLMGYGVMVNLSAQR